MTAIMEGIRILEVAEHTFVPAASAVLADWGAEVIKVEHVERGDAMRGLGSTGVMDLGSGVHVLLEHSNRGKRSIGLDLSKPEGVDIVYKLAAQCDVFLTNKMPGVRRRLHIDVDDIRAHNPNIVYVRGSGYGARGPEADRGGYDQISFWCRGGSAMGAKPQEWDHIPIQPAPGYGDSLGAMTIAGGISAALLHRERTGHAPIVDVSLLGTGMWAMGAAIALSQQLGTPWLQMPAGGGAIRNPLVGTYRTSDDKWIALSMLQGFFYWPEMCQVLGLTELLDDPRFDTHEALQENATVAAQMVAEVFRSDTFENWKKRLANIKGQWSPVQDSLEVVDDPQSQANGYVLEARTKDGTAFKLVTTPVQFDEEPSPPKRAPEFNEHGDDILTQDLGIDWDTVIDLKVKGIVA
ncbi:MAG TPA: CoA transferase [Acidimicrobiia bacterium]|nr:CoA transferase [Acidimicrobiia bacterium]